MLSHDSLNGSQVKRKHWDTININPVTKKNKFGNMYKHRKQHASQIVGS